MFNNISHEELMNIIAKDAIATLLYHDPGGIPYHWEDGTWQKMLNSQS